MLYGSDDTAWLQSPLHLNTQIQQPHARQKWEELKAMDRITVLSQNNTQSATEGKCSVAAIENQGFNSMLIS